MKSDEFRRVVRANGWSVVRQTGSHIIYRKGNMTYPVPYHKGKEIGTGLERKMRRDMGLR
jgi:predicted RNA binding protein YcfA (HicA-like mRNA interferase family)